MAVDYAAWLTEIVRRLCACNSRKKALRSGGTVAVAASIATLRAHPDNPDMIQQACRALAELAKNRGNQVIAVRDGVLPLLFAALRNKRLHGTPLQGTPIILVPQLCMLLTDLLEDNPDHQAAAVRAGSNAVLLEVIQSASTVYPPRDSMGVAAASCRALWATIFDNPHNQALTVKEGAIPILTTLLSAITFGSAESHGVEIRTALRSASLDAVTAACKVLRTLTVFNSDHATQARSAGVLEVLESLLSSVHQLGKDVPGVPAAEQAISRVVDVLRASL